MNPSIDKIRAIFCADWVTRKYFGNPSGAYPTVRPMRFSQALHEVQCYLSPDPIGDKLEARMLESDSAAEWAKRKYESCRQSIDKVTMDLMRADIERRPAYIHSERLRAASSRLLHYRMEYKAARQVKLTATTVYSKWCQGMI